MKRLSTLNGKKLPIRFGWGALSNFADSTNKTIDDVIYAFDPSNLKPSQFTEFVYFGVLDGCAEEGIQCPFESPKDIIPIIDNNGLKKVIKETLDAFQASPFILNSREEGDEEEGKKK